jgi:parallel beta-helix repeat protein
VQYVSKVALIAVSLLCLSSVAQSRRTLSISPSDPSIQIGQSIQFHASVDGSSVSARWSVSDPIVATMSSDGTVLGRNAGRSIVRAQVKNLRAETTITVVGVDPAPSPPTPTPNPPPSDFGPQVTITCPDTASPIAPGGLQAAIDSAAAGAVVCIGAGVHAVQGSLHPKTGTVIVGQYGAILDGTGWSTSDETAAAFRCTTATGVTIRNLTIRNMPKKGVYTDHACEHWTLEHNRIEQTQWGVRLAGSPVTLRRNSLHGSGRGVSGGNYSIYMTRNPVLIESNEIAYGGDQQKAMNTAAVTWRGNWVHHNDYAGIWNDGEGNGSILEQNTIEDNAGPGIMWELSYGGTIRQNTIRRSGDQAVYVSTSRDTLIDGNTLEDNWRGVTLYLSCPSLTQGWPWNPDLANNTIRGNLTAIGTRPESIGALLAYSGECSSTQVAPYLSNAKNNRFEANRYAVPSLSGSWWLWNGWQNWAAWQGLGHDVAGSVGVR